MTLVPRTVEERFRASVRGFQRVLEAAKARDINEPDTVTIVKDMLSDVFGYDKYQEVTSEYSIRGTYCDLAVKLRDKLHLLIEVKAIGLELKDHHLRQAVDYAAKEGVDWVILTNGVLWRLHRVSFAKPLDAELVFELDFLGASLKDPGTLEKLFLLTREAVSKEAISAYHREQQLKNKFTLAAILMGDEVVSAVRRSFNRLTKEVRITDEEIVAMMLNDLLKREVTEAEKFKQAVNLVRRAQARKVARAGKEEAKPEASLPPAEASHPSPGSLHLQSTGPQDQDS